MTYRLASTAVMARRAEPAGSLDFFPTPPWATRALCTHILPQAWPWPDLFNCAAWDPACGEGHMAVALAEYFVGVRASDIFGYGFSSHVSDFLLPDPVYSPESDWIISNPPFNRAAEFVHAACGQARRGVAMLVRTQFAEGQARYRELFKDMPPQIDAVFTERVPMHRGRWVVARSKDGGGSSATSYSWMVWLTRPRGAEWQHSRRIWIPPCKKQLTKPGDWLTFGGCMDVPANHRVMKRIEQLKRDVKAPATPGQMRELKQQLEAMI
ncbi:hypothetical protein [Mesorhizobium sp. Z1-4]|uniref:hypothetical protein n=1 Tax=Mesorhizobium sp. Z1-4 TaxID=2448478 RepID=UPI001FE05EDF|nr:hypothetical protein [Mesorhizobium sp. Z1-4]